MLYLALYIRYRIIILLDSNTCLYVQKSVILVIEKNV